MIMKRYLFVFVMFLSYLMLPAQSLDRMQWFN